MKKIVLLFFSIGMFGVSCGQQKSAGEVLSPEAFADFIVGDGIQLIDVRTPEEFSEGHINGASNVNYNSPDFAGIVVNNFDTARPLAIYCRSGVRSNHAAVILTDRGFKVYQLDGGLRNWKGELIK